MLNQISIKFESSRREQAVNEVIGLDELIKLEEEAKKPKEVEPPALVEEDANEGIEHEETNAEIGKRCNLSIVQSFITRLYFTMDFAINLSSLNRKFHFVCTKYKQRSFVTEPTEIDEEGENVDEENEETKDDSAEKEKEANEAEERLKERRKLMEESSVRLQEALRMYSVIAIQTYLLETGAVTEIKDRLSSDFNVTFNH